MHIFGCFLDELANVAYQEVDLPADFVRKFHRYIPNTYFSACSDNHASRFVVVFFCCGHLAEAPLFW